MLPSQREVFTERVQLPLLIRAHKLTCPRRRLGFVPGGTPYQGPREPPPLMVYPPRMQIQSSSPLPIMCQRGRDYFTTVRYIILKLTSTLTQYSVSEHIASEMVAIDGPHNGWRCLVLFVAQTDELVMCLSHRFISHLLAASKKTMTKLRCRIALSSADSNDHIHVLINCIQLPLKVCSGERT